MAEIITRRGQIILLDDDDFERFGCYRWHVNDSGYAARNVAHPSRPGKWMIERMHRAILCLKVGDGTEVDHANGNKLDNRRENLRICTRAENQRNKGRYSRNSSGFKGVSIEPKTKKWQARIHVFGRPHNLGYFDTPELAHAAYCAAANELHGEFARTT